MEDKIPRIFFKGIKSDILIGLFMDEGSIFILCFDFALHWVFSNFTEK